MNRNEAIANLVGLAVIVAIATAFWSLFKGPVIFVLTLGILIAVHEWGHFIAARCCGVRVYEFALGFGPKITTYMRRKGTEYTVRAIPAGGFVNLKGMMPEEAVTADGVSGRRPAERAIVYLAGPLMNIILAALVFVLTPLLVGSANEKQILVVSVERKQAASQMRMVSRNGQPATNGPRGLSVGDEVLRVNGAPVSKIEDLTRPVNSSIGKEVQITVRRNREELVFAGIPKAEKQELPRAVVVDAVPAATSLALKPGDLLEELNGEPVLGLAEPLPQAERILREKAGQHVTAQVWRNGVGSLDIAGTAGPLTLRQAAVQREVGRLRLTPLYGMGPPLSLSDSLNLGFRNLTTNMSMLFGMFAKPKELSNNVGGVISIGSMIFQVGNLPPIYWCNQLASLSVSLAIFNLLPIPVLDGGHLLILFWETIRRRRLGIDAYRRVFAVGIAIVGTLALAITLQDIVRHFL